MMEILSRVKAERVEAERIIATVIFGMEDVLIGSRALVATGGNRVS